MARIVYTLKPCNGSEILHEGLITINDSTLESLTEEDAEIYVSNFVEYDVLERLDIDIHDWKYGLTFTDSE